MGTSGAPQAPSSVAVPDVTSASAAQSQEEHAGPRAAGNALLGQFTARAEAAGAEVHRVPTRSEALFMVLDRLATEGVADSPGSWGVWAGCPFLNGLDAAELMARVPGLRFDVSREVAAGALVGISQLDWAIANTGSIAQNATGVDQRLVSTLPVTHIALVPSDQVVADLAAFLTVQSPRDAGYISLITGPSRTADIERVLTIGVHGPEQLVIILVDGLGAGTTTFPGGAR